MATVICTFFLLIVTFCDGMDEEGPGLQAVSVVMVELASKVMVIMISR